MNQLKILKEMQIQKNEISIVKYTISPELLSSFSGTNDYLGVDPGTSNFGLAEITGDGNITAIQIKTIREETIGDRIEKFLNIINRTFSFPSYAIMTIEGASYSASRYRQVELAEIRAIAVYWAMERAALPYVIPPNTLRKKVFGNGKIKAHEVWPELPPDAAAALSCALYGMITQTLSE